MNALTNIDTYISAKWNIAVCTSGESGIEKIEYPYGKDMKNNRILDTWLESMVNFISPENSKTFSIGGGLVFSRLTDGWMQLGTGTKPISNKDRQLDKFYRKTNYIRFGFDRATGTYISGSGMVIFSRTYDFITESQPVLYTEAGFESAASSIWNSSLHRNSIWSRFLFTQDTGAIGFLSGYIDNGGNFQISKNLIDQGSGALVNGIYYPIPAIKNKKSEIIYGYRSGFRNEFNQFIPFNDASEQYKHAKLSGYFYENKQSPFENKNYFSENITGYISGYRDFFGNFSGFDSQNLQSSSGYYLNNSRYQFAPIKTNFTENIIGFRSGYGDSFGNFSGFDDDLAQSGYYIFNDKKIFPTGEYFSGFSGQSGFDESLGFQYSGFQFQNISGFSGIDGTSSGTGIITGYIGFRNYRAESGIFSGFSGQIGFDTVLGFRYDGFFITGSGFSGINDSISGTGILTGIIGYRNNFSDRPISGFSGISGFDEYLGFEYSGFNNPPFGFSGTEYLNYGTGIQTGIIGYRNIITYSGDVSDGFNNIPSFEYGWKYNPGGVLFNPSNGSGFVPKNILKSERLIGFKSGYYDSFGNFYYLTIPSPTSNGYSGYIISGKKYYFNFDTIESGFSGREGFNSGIGFLYSGLFLNGSGFSGDNWPVKKQEKIIGFTSGFQDQFGQFYDFKDLYPELKSSGYFIDGKQYFFPTGTGQFSGFSGLSGFDSAVGFSYTGFSFPEGFGFSGLNFLNSGTGIRTGFIGNRNILTYPITGVTGSITGLIGSRNFYFETNTGAMTGIIGIKQILSGIYLTTGQFIKVKYDVAMRIPAMVQPVPVTGEDIVYGDFNGSGQLKLIGRYDQIFGSIDSNGRSSNAGGNGFWWPVHKEITKFGRAGNSPYPTLNLSAVLIGEPKSDMPYNHLDGTYWHNSTTPPPFPAENNTNFMYLLKLGDEFNYSIPRSNFYDETWYYSSSVGRTGGSSFPMYYFNTIIPEYNYTQNVSYPNSIKYTYLFRADFPPSDERVGGIMITPTFDVCPNPNGCRRADLFEIAFPYVFEDWNAFIFGAGIPSTSRNTPYVGWYYRFNNYQTKYEDQLIALTVTFSVNRETYV